MQQRSLEYSFERRKALFETKRIGLDRAFLDRCKDNAIRDASAIVVIGLPRSGTSLVEQICASHPLGYGSGGVE